MKTFADIEVGGLFGFWEQGLFCIYRKHDEHSAEFMEADGCLMGCALTDFDPKYTVFQLT